ncbi:glycosyltransferase [Opitutia bacterium ISCC 52]|nr:glycosyltransferase [Opitutae bacterium ISCC 52]
MTEVSIIMPIKNAETHLVRAINSIRSQSYKDWVLMVVDDNSKDTSYQLAETQGGKDPRIRLIQNSNPGIADALNRGIALSAGSYIARMDADDVSHPERLREQVKFLNERPEIGLVGTQVNFLGDRDKHAGYAAYVDWTNDLVSWKDIRMNRFVESPFAHPSVMFRRSLVSANDETYQQGNFPEDYELWLRWMDAGIQMGKINSPLLDWYDPPGRLSRIDPRYSPDSFYRTKAKYLAKWLKKERFIDRPIWIWGAGRITRKRAQFFEDHGIQFSGYLDIDPRKTNTDLNGIPVLQPDQLDLSKKPFIISYVGSRGAREKIRYFLISKGLQEEHDFILAA